MISFVLRCVDDWYFARIVAHLNRHANSHLVSDYTILVAFILEIVWILKQGKGVGMRLPRHEPFARVHTSAPYQSTGRCPRCRQTERIWVVEIARVRAKRGRRADAPRQRDPLVGGDKPGSAGVVWWPVRSRRGGSAHSQRCFVNLHDLCAWAET